MSGTAGGIALALVGAAGVAGMYWGGPLSSPSKVQQNQQQEQQTPQQQQRPSSPSGRNWERVQGTHEMPRVREWVGGTLNKSLRRYEGQIAARKALKGASFKSE